MVWSWLLWWWGVDVGLGCDLAVTMLVDVVG